MLMFRYLLIALFCCSSILPALFAEEASIEFEELQVEGGKVYRDCKVTASDAEGFLIRHSGGMARISFFDVGKEIQEQFDFDPVEALRIYKTRLEEERMRRKQLLLETEKQKAAIARRDAIREQERIAREEWIPVQAEIIDQTETGLFVNAQRITFVPTKVKSTLGFERDGPPKRILKPFSSGTIFLEKAKMSDSVEGKWLGYVHPQSAKGTSHPKFPKKTVPVHLAVPRQ